MNKRCSGSMPPMRDVTTAPNSGGPALKPVDTTSHKVHQHGKGTEHDGGTAGSGHAGGMGHGGTANAKKGY